MFNSHQAYEDDNLDPNLQEHGFKRSRQNVSTAKSRSRRSAAKTRVSRKRSSAQPVIGMAHRRQRKWTW